MRLTFRVALLTLLLAAGLAAHATLTVTNKTGFGVNWFFHNTDTKYTDFWDLGTNAATGSSSYFRDYNADGLLDYLINLKDPKTGSMRLFCLNTNPAISPANGERTYASHKTAWRDFLGGAGKWYLDAYTPISPKMDSPDLVVANTNRASLTDFQFSSLTFTRLKKTDKTWPTELSVTAALPVKALWAMVWTPVSMNADDYPDILVFTTQPTTTRKYYVYLYDGKTFALIWGKTFAMDANDGGNVNTPFPSTSNLLVYTLPILPVPEAGRADFDGNGKPEILLYNPFTKMEMNMTTYELVIKGSVNINLLDSNGNALSSSGYSATTWTNVVKQQTGAYFAPMIAITGSDFDKDGYRDIMFENLEMASSPPPAVFEGYSLKKRLSLFKSVAADFGAKLEDSSGFRSMDTCDIKRGVAYDVTGDGYTDLVTFRDKGEAIDANGNNVPVTARIGLFNAKGGTAGRKVWLNTSTFTSYDRFHPDANDFNGDRIADCVVAKNPTSPAAPTWTIGNTNLTKSAITLARSFTYTCSAATTWNATTDEFNAQSLMFGPFGDVNNNGQADTYGILFWELDRSTNGTTDDSGGSVLMYDNPSGTGAPPINARFDVKITGENKDAIMIINRALAMTNTLFVDNNKNGKTDDVVVSSDNFVYSLSLTATGAYPAAAAATAYSPASGTSIKYNAPLAWNKSEGAIGYNVYIGTSSSVVSGATTTSAEYRGEVAAPFYLPYPALSAGKTYYWRVDPINAWGKVTKGATWSFVTTN